MPPARSSPWKVVGLGCVSLVAVIGLAFVAFLFVGQRLARTVHELADDPRLSAARAHEALHAERLPDGYRPTLVASVPLLGRVVVLETEPEVLAPDGAIGPAGMFLYLERSGADSDRTWAEHLDRLLEVRGLEIETGPVVAEEAFDSVTLRSLRARLHSRPAGEWPVTAALLLVRCGFEDDVLRFGAWIEADATPGVFRGDADPTGTPADPAAVRTFVSEFRFCGV